MKKKGYSETQIIGILKEVEGAVRRLQADHLSLEEEVRRPWRIGIETTENSRGGKPAAEEESRPAGDGQRHSARVALKKLVTPRASRDAVKEIGKKKTHSERRACEAVGVSRSTVR